MEKSTPPMTAPQKLKRRPFAVKVWQHEPVTTHSAQRLNSTLSVQCAAKYMVRKIHSPEQKQKHLIPQNGHNNKNLIRLSTLPEIKIAPENGWLDYFPLGSWYVRAVSFRKCFWSPYVTINLQRRSLGSRDIEKTSMLHAGALYSSLCAGHISEALQAIAAARREVRFDGGWCWFVGWGWLVGGATQRWQNISKWRF